MRLHYACPEPMSRARQQPLISRARVLLPVLLVLGLWLGGHPEDLPAFAAQAFVADRRRASSTKRSSGSPTTTTARSPRASSSNASIAGVVASLDDRFSHYLSPERIPRIHLPAALHRHRRRGRPAGIDVDHGLLIERVFNSSPAARAGLKAGELIVAVNGRKLEGLSAETATALIRGLPGTDVTLAVHGPTAGAHPRQRHLRNVELTRAVVSEPVVESVTRTVHGVKLGVVALATFSPGAHAKCAKRSNTSCTRAPAGSCSTCAATAAAWSRRRS